MRHVTGAVLLTLAAAGLAADEAAAQGYWTNPLTGAPWPGPYGPIDDNYPNGSSYVGPMVYPNRPARAAYGTRYTYRPPQVQYVQPPQVQYVQPPQVQYVQPPQVRYYYVYPQGARAARPVGRRRGFLNNPSSAPYLMPPMGFPPARTGIPAGMNYPPPML